MRLQQLKLSIACVADAQSPALESQTANLPHELSSRSRFACFVIPRLGYARVEEGARAYRALQPLLPSGSGGTWHCTPHSTRTRSTHQHAHTPGHTTDDSPSSCETSPLLPVERAGDDGWWWPRRWAGVLGPGGGLYDRISRLVCAVSQWGKSSRASPGRGDVALGRIPSSGAFGSGDLDS